MQKCTWSLSVAVEEEALMRGARSALAPSLEQSQAAQKLGVLGGVLGTELALPSSSPPRSRCSGFWVIPNSSGFSCFICLLCAFLLSSQKLQVARGFGWTCDRALSDIFLCLLLTSRLAAGFPEGPLPSTGAAGKVQGEEGGGKGRAGG